MIPFDNTYARLPDHFHSFVAPAHVPNPKLIRLNKALAEDLGLDLVWLKSPSGLAMLAGNTLPTGAEPLAQAYGGHQLGGWVPQLGDGRAILLGEILNLSDQRRDIQLKGAGRTPFSRGGDGKAALGPVLREYILSEAMHALGVPTTRALAAVSTGETVRREELLPGAILTRVAASHIRVGTFQYFYAQNDVSALKTLADHAIARHYPIAANTEMPYVTFLEGVVAAQAKLIAQWMHLGFIHGVMNTDNMTISGETIDYGPCAFIDTFSTDKVFSSIDRQGRYAWGNQAVIGQWNLLRLAEAILPLFSPDLEKARSLAEGVIEKFTSIFREHYLSGYQRKLGLSDQSHDGEAFLKRTLGLLEEQSVDYTLFFRHLTKLASGDDDPEAFKSLFKEAIACQAWLEDWREHKIDVDIMRTSNPVLIPRNHRVEEAIRFAQDGDYAPFHRLVDALERPFDDRPEFEDLEAAPTPAEEVRATFCGT